MLAKKMELKPTIGIGDLRFGMSQNMVFETIGLPDNIKEDDMDSNNVYLEYYNQKLRLTFYKNEDNRLGYIYSANPQLSYKKIEIQGKGIDWVKNTVFANLAQNWEIEVYDFWSTHSDNKSWLTLNVEFGKVYSVEIGVPWKNEDDYDWPELFKIV